MDILLWPALIAVVILNAYTMRFTAVTLRMGRELANSDSATGFQDAITPPWLTNVALAEYVAVPVVLGLIWWSLGWIALIAALVVGTLGAFVLAGFLGVFVDYYRRVIIASMMSRYADYVRDRDRLRADAMKELLQRAGFDVEG
jgi:hypothetical protein